jgi:hypothetical protein
MAIQNANQRREIGCFDLADMGISSGGSMKLTAEARKAIPTSKFAGPGRSFPVPDKSHAANAKARATQGVNAGTLSPTTAAKIRAKANKVLGK